MTIVVDDGEYDSQAESFKEIWATYRTMEPDNFQHSTDFKTAIATVAENKDEFCEAIARDPTSFAQTVAIGHQMGRVISQHKIWDYSPDVENSFRFPQLDGIILQFYTYTSREITKFRYNIDKMEIESATTVKTLGLR